jgi:threonine dehydrogenase-like Zn-dependent dehydrogenase
MKAAAVTGPDEFVILDIPVPEVGPADVLVRMRACGLCGSDPITLTQGYLVPGAQLTRLGHEPAGIVESVGAEVSGLNVGDQVVINPMGVPDAIIGGGGPQGALSEFVVVREARVGVNLRVMPAHVPAHVAALTEPLSVARRAVNRTRPQPDSKAVVFGAGPVGLGALLAFQAHGAAHVVVVDVQPNRLKKALALGADAVIDSRTEDVAARLVELHGDASDAFGITGHAGTDIFIDAAGVPAVVNTVIAAAKQGAVFGIVAIHHTPIEVQFQDLIPTELTIIASMGYEDEFFQVADDLEENWEKYALIVGDVIPFGEVERAIRLAGTPGATDKVVVTFD